MLVPRLLAIGFLLHAACIFGQTPPALVFEAASIKASGDGPGSSGINSTPGRINARNVTLKRCIRGAYGIEEPRILDGPKWIDQDRYYIEAKAAGPAGDTELMVMLQALLAERFKLAVHREQRVISGYALVAGKGELKAKRSDAGVGSRTNLRRGGIDGVSCTMAQLAMKLSEALHMPVTDATGIDGRFDIELKWTETDAMQARPPGPGAEMAPTGPSIFTALQEQLGLRLQSRKVAAEVLVVDHAEKPSEN